MRIVLIRAHAPRPGAVFDPDKFGPLPERREALLSEFVCERVFQKLLENDVEVVIAPGVHTSDRRGWCAEQRPAPIVSVEIHFNAGYSGNDYVGCWSYHGSGLGRVARDTLSPHLRAWGRERGLGCVTTEVLPAPVETSWPRVEEALRWTRRLDCAASGILIEGPFVDNPDSNLFSIESLESLAAVIASGIQQVTS